MGADKGKKAKIVEGGEEEDGTKLFPFVEKLQEIQDDLEKVTFLNILFFDSRLRRRYLFSLLLNYGYFLSK